MMTDSDRGLSAGHLHLSDRWRSTSTATALPPPHALVFSPHLQAQLGSHWEEFRALARERSPEMYNEGMLALGGRLEASGNLQGAASIYQAIVHSEGEATAPFRERAQRHLDAMMGVGSSAYRSEFLLRRLAREAMEPTTLAGLTAASAAFRMTRLASLSRLAGSPAANLVTRGFGARAAASLTAFGVEATVFPLATRGAAAVLGRDLDWSLSQVSREIAGSFIILGAMKLTGWGAATLGNRNVGANLVFARPGTVLGGIGRSQGSPLQGILQQGGMFAGIFLGHRLETAVGLRPHLDGATNFVDSLAMLVQFNAAARLAHGIMGPGFHAWEQGLDHQARVLSSSRVIGRGGPMWPPVRGSMATAAGGHVGPPLRAGMDLSPFHPNIIGRPVLPLLQPQMSEMSGEGNGSGDGNGRLIPSLEVAPRPAEPARPKGRSGQHVIVLRPEEAGAPLEIGLRQFADMLPQAVAFFEIPSGERAGEVLMANSKVEALLGYSPDEAMQKSILDFFNPRDSRVYTALLNRFPREQSLPLRDIQLLRKDGTSVWCDVNLSIANFPGRRLGFASFENVSARHEAAERLAATEARNQALIDAFPDNIFRINRNFEFLDVRAKYDHGLSVPRMPGDHVEGGNVQDLKLPPGLVQLGVTTIARAFESGNLERAEYSIPFSDGSTRYQEARVQKSGADEVIIIVRDITDLKRATLENERLLQIIENSADYISMATTDGKIFYNNAAARTIMGYDPAFDLSSLTPADFHPQWALEKIMNEGVPMALETGVWVGETALRHTGGRDVPVHQMILANRNEAGEITHFSTIIRDITDLKRTQDARIAQGRLDTIKLMSRGLAHDGNNAVTPLEPYLRMVEKYLTELDNKVNELNGILTRPVEQLTIEEIRRMQSQLRGIKDGHDRHNPQESIEIVMNLSERIRGMFERFRVLTAEPVEAAPFDLHALFKRPSLELQPLLGDEVRLDIRMAPQPFRVRIPKEQMRDIIQNLLVNARDAMVGRPDPYVRIETSYVTLTPRQIARLMPLTQSRTVNPGEYLKLVVSDTGTGMSESTRRQIFTPYFTTKQKADNGHGGIGLALVQKYVEDAGGFIAVRSALGAGASFELYFPRAESVRAKRDPALSERIYNTPVLIADDEPHLLRLAVQSFTQRGFRTVHQASNGRDAARILEENPDIGFLLTDVELPEIPGTRLIMQAKKMRPRMAMVVWTGKDPQPFEAYLNRFGSAVGKPISLEDVMDQAETLLEQSHSPDPE